MDFNSILLLILEMGLPLIIYVAWRAIRPNVENYISSTQRAATIQELDTLVASSVSWANQKFVEQAKREGSFSPKMANEVRDKVVVEVLENLSKDSYESLSREHSGNVENIIRHMIERHVVLQK